MYTARRTFAAAEDATSLLHIDLEINSFLWQNYERQNTNSLLPYFDQTPAPFTCHKQQRLKDVQQIPEQIQKTHFWSIEDYIKIGF